MLSSFIQNFCKGSTPVEIATLCFAIIGGTFAWWQWRRSCRVSRAEHLNAILERYSDKGMINLFYRLVNNTTYGGEDSDVFYPGGLRFQDVKDKTKDEERAGYVIRENDVDAMLLMFSQICYEHERGTISKVEFDFFCFQIRRTLAHKQFKQYLLDFATYCGKFGIGYPFLALAREGINVDNVHYAQVLAEARRKRYTFVNRLKELLP